MAKTDPAYLASLLDGRPVDPRDPRYFDYRTQSRGPAGGPTLSEYKPTPKDKAARALLRIMGDTPLTRELLDKGFGSSGLGDRPITAGGAPLFLANPANWIAEAANSGERAGAAMAAGRPGAALKEAGITALNVLPVGGSTKGMAKLAAETARRGGKAVAGKVAQAGARVAAASADDIARVGAGLFPDGSSPPLDMSEGARLARATEQDFTVPAMLPPTGGSSNGSKAIRAAGDAAKGSASADDAARLASAVVGDAPPPRRRTSRAPVTGLRGQAAAPNLRDMDLPKAIRTARKEPHLVQGPGGQYVGAPRGATTKAGVRANRRAFDADVKTGAAGGDWYTRARAANALLPGPDPARQRLFAREQALWSAQANPDTNLNFALQAHNAYEMGQPLTKARTGQQARTYAMARDAGVDIPLGPKTGIYGQHLDPTAEHATTGTNDIWHARGFGFRGDPVANPMVGHNGGPALDDLAAAVDPANITYKPFSRALSGEEHKFLDYETVLAVDRANRAGLGGRSDWNAHEIQAAPWVTGKGRQLAVKHFKTKDLSPEQIDWGVAQASKSYPDIFDKYTGLATFEAQTYAKGRHLAGLQDREGFAAHPASSWMGEDGRDIIYNALHAYTRPTVKATGLYTPKATGITENNRAFVARPLVGMSPDGKAGPKVDDASKAMLDIAEGVRAYTDVQGGGAWHKRIENAPPGASGSVFVPNDGPMTVDQLLALGDASNGPIGTPVPPPGEMGPIQPATLGDVVDTGNGATITNWWPGPPTGTETGKALKSGMNADIQQIVPGAPPKRIKVQSNLMDYEEAWQAEEGSGEATRKLMSLFDNQYGPAALDHLDSDPGIRRIMLEKNERDLAALAAEGNLPLRQDVLHARRIISEGGFRGLFEAMQRGELLPAVAIPLLGLGAFLGSQQEEPAAGQPGA